jgi:hypothetical protein
MPEPRDVRRLELDHEPGHLAAASGIAVAGRTLYAVADDELGLGVFDLDDPGPGRMLGLLDGEALPADHATRKSKKPDLEGLAIVDGRLVALGSGSGEERHRGATWALDADGALQGSPAQLELGALYRVLGDALEHLNVEGVAALDDRLLLANRGDSAGDGNALVHLDLRACAAALEHGGELPPDAIVDVVRLDLGEVEGETMQISDIVSWGSELAFTAIAEDAPDPYEDGPFTGAALGRLRPDGTVLACEALRPALKVEGLAHGGGREVLLATDDDERATPARLLRCSLP